MNWDWRKERNEKHRFVEERMTHRRPVFAVALIFIVVWLCGWACSAFFLAYGMGSIPERYVISTVASYVAFVGAVGVWCRYAAQPIAPKSSTSDWTDAADIPNIGGDEGCLVVVAVLAIALVLSGVFWMVGGYAMLFEVAFEVAFAGTVVSGLDRRYTVGDWAGALIRRTWIPALIVGAALVAFAAKMQHDHPEAKTLAQAFKAQSATALKPQRGK
jgi:hypothetical protein